MNMTALSVGQLNLYVKSLLESDRNLRSLWIRGELSNFVRNAKSGHCYFSLKDADGSVRAVMFRSAATGLTFVPGDGMQVLLHGRVSLYERDGQYQFYADQMLPDGTGQAYLEFLRIKKMLSEEGLFDRKKPLPLYPETVGVCTSLTGAAVKDFIRVCHQLAPSLKIVIYPCLMQGSDTVSSVLSGMEYFRTRKDVDLVVITRGGGSYEDLAVFNDELLARYVAAYPLPVISAVGHEIDVTILDYAADFRAATPSVAAQAAVGQIPVLSERLTRLLRSADASVENRLQREERDLDHLMHRFEMERIFEREAQRIDLLSMRRDHAAAVNGERVLASFSQLTARLEGVNPLSILARGYSYAERDGVPVFKAQQLHPGDRFTLYFQDGGIYCAAETEL